MSMSPDSHVLNSESGFPQTGSRAEACKQMRKGIGKKSVLLFPVSKCEIRSILGSINKRDHLYRKSHFTICRTGITQAFAHIAIVYDSGHV